MARSEGAVRALAGKGPGVRLWQDRRGLAENEHQGLYPALLRMWSGPVRGGYKKGAGKSRGKGYVGNRRTMRYLTLLLICTSVSAQSIKPGFEAAEYLRLLEICNRQIDTPWGPHEQKLLPEPTGCRMVYRSPVTGLDNRWDLWLEGDSVGVISIRGSIGREESWIENFYCAMVPATGILQLNDSTTFKYRLAGDFKACVHLGWLIGMASIAPDIVGKIREYHARGIRQFIIMGHSQGGSI